MDLRTSVHLSVCPKPRSICGTSQNWIFIFLVLTISQNSKKEFQKAKYIIFHGLSKTSAVPLFTLHFIKN